MSRLAAFSPGNIFLILAAKYVFFFICSYSELSSRSFCPAKRERTFLVCLKCILRGVKVVPSHIASFVILKATFFLKLTQPTNQRMVDQLDFLEVTVHIRRRKQFCPCLDLNNLIKGPSKKS